MTPVPDWLRPIRRSAGGGRWHWWFLWPTLALILVAFVLRDSRVIAPMAVLLGATMLTFVADALRSGVVEVRGGTFVRDRRPIRSGFTWQERV